MQTWTDHQLVQAVKSGNKSAQGVIYQRYYSKVFQKCYHYVNDADIAFDLTQEILIKSFDKIASFKEESKFGTWLFVIATNYCIEYLRKHSKYSFDTLDNHYQLADPENDSEANGWIIAREKAVKEIMISLSESDQQMLLLKYEQGTSIKDLQLMFNLSSSAVKMRLKRAKGKVESIYRKQQLFAEAG